MEYLDLSNKHLFMGFGLKIVELYPFAVSVISSTLLSVYKQLHVFMIIVVYHVHAYVICTCMIMNIYMYMYMYV